MAISLRASAYGLQMVDIARRKKGWSKGESNWSDEAKISDTTLKRFWARKSIKRESFIAICKAVNLDWDEIMDSSGYNSTSIPKIKIVNEGLADKKSRPLKNTSWEPLQQAQMPFSIQSITDLQTIRNHLVNSISKDEIISESLSTIRHRIMSQTASIFLFGKDGKLHRSGLDGVDYLCTPIPNNWFNQEHYSIHESLTGRCATPAVDGYGIPIKFDAETRNEWENNFLAEGSKLRYEEKIGPIYCAMAVPLNGKSRTFGVLTVINKVDYEGRSSIDYKFGINDFFWLSIMGSFVATAISNYRRDKQNILFSDLSERIIECLVGKSDPQKTYQLIANRLISPETAFQVCILRIRDNSGHLTVAAKSGIEKVDWSNRYNEDIEIYARNSKDDIPREAITNNNPITFDINTNSIERFLVNKKWVEDNLFKSYACFRIALGDNILGTISLYTGYQYNFHPSCVRFLKRVVSLLASFMGAKSLDDFRKSVDLNFEPNINLKEDIFSFDSSSKYSNELGEINISLN